MIKAVIFDIGGVILDSEQLMKPVQDVFMPKDKDKFWQELNESFSYLCRGEGKLYDFWKKFAKEKGMDIPDEILRKLWDKDFEESLLINEEVKGIISSLKKNYKLAIISNIINEHASVLKKNKSFIEIHNMFDVITFSNEVRMSKDTKDIFLHTIKLLNVKPEECVFTDDTKKFVGVAKSLGINAVQFKTAEQFRKDLVNFGVKV
jgi:HAD superfamily hydrolase (TIGR01509 family)